VASDNQTEEHLPTSEEKWKDILENAPVGIFQSTPDGRFIDMNPTLAYQFGFSSPQEMIQAVTNIPAQIFVHPEQRPPLIQKAMESETFVRSVHIPVDSDRHSDLIATAIPE
jgi:PAS domain S-box-containing protein